MTGHAEPTVQGIISSFVPQDRLAALAAGRTLPARSQGAALFIDIAGFSSLTDALVTGLGPHRGAEELTLILNRVFAALVEAAEAMGGYDVDSLTRYMMGTLTVPFYAGDSQP
jgi:class 3 adenylate cyclase